jgi:anti-sigma B factor antagonist
VNEDVVMGVIAWRSVASGSVDREEWGAGLSVLHVEGPLRAPVGWDLGRQVEALLARGRRGIVVDLSNVTEVDAAGVGELVRLYTLAAAAGGELSILTRSARVRRLLGQAGLLEMLDQPSPLALTQCS